MLISEIPGRQTQLGHLSTAVTSEVKARFVAPRAALRLPPLLLLEGKDLPFLAQTWVSAAYLSLHKNVLDVSRNSDQLLRRATVARRVPQGSPCLRQGRHD
ncbi:hypothetical protein Y032_0032g2541 [Ancylostoma ceylanicum]|uniref:Uncharacterized protein n=1 Tax=Ancylostoma ceylanicum TaxID=53326 RepID=A0A016UNT5_9BILA|nr:hypothetical protein Y032_0032g2541 [Ancylostoma ceylanicum]